MSIAMVYVNFYGFVYIRDFVFLLVLYKCIFRDRKVFYAYNIDQSSSTVLHLGMAHKCKISEFNFKSAVFEASLLFLERRVNCFLLLE